MEKPGAVNVVDVRSLGIVDDDTMLRCATRCYDELQCYDATERRSIPATAPLKMHISHEEQNPPSSLLPSFLFSSLASLLPSSLTTLLTPTSSGRDLRDS